MNEQKRASGKKAPVKKTRAGKSTVRKAPPKKALAKKTQAKKGVPAVKRPAAKRAAGRAITAEERHRMIAEAAYHIAEARGFKSETALDDWLRAEAEVDARLAKRR